MHGCAECARGGERDAKDRRWGNPADTLLYTYLKDVLTSPPLSTDINGLPGTTTMNDTRNNDVNLTLIISHVLPTKQKMAAKRPCPCLFLPLRQLSVVSWPWRSPSDDEGRCLETEPVWRSTPLPPFDPERREWFALDQEEIRGLG